MDILTGINTRVTPQNQAARPDQVKNSAGGFVFQISDAERLKRFLILGTDAGTYYINAQDLTRANAEVPLRMAIDEPDVLLSTILDVSQRGAAPKQNATLFALAIACSFGDLESRQKALAALPKVARTGTHLFLFARYVEQFRGWGRSLRTAVGDWYMSKSADTVAYQAVKYRQREGWSHRDMLRLSHPRSVDPKLNAVFDWITHNAVGDETPTLIESFIKANEETASVSDICKLIETNPLTWEMLPDRVINDPAIWTSLLVSNRVGLTALIRQLPRLTRIGLLEPFSDTSKIVEALITDRDQLHKARIHPINLLVAHRTYSNGHSERGSSTWTPVSRIVDALDFAFYKAFESFEPAGKRTMLALDVSGSMGSGVTATGISAREASGALALVTMATEPETFTVGFTGGGWGWGGRASQQGVENLTPLNISPRQRLNDVIRAISNLPFGGTDCALPMLYAAKKKLPVDTFVIYTDNETWAGSIHPHQALKQYRDTMGIDAKVVVVGMTATDFSIADPNDSGMLDVVGFDTAVPSLINQFSRGV